MRSSVDVVLGLVTAAGVLTALASIPDDQYVADWLQRQTNLAMHEPRWYPVANYALMAWYWSEVVVMLFNARRRAVHDFIAGTVVIDDGTVTSSRVAFLTVLVLCTLTLVYNWWL